MTREELLKIAKPMMVNLEVAKTIQDKTQTRRLIKDKVYLDESDNFNSIWGKKQLSNILEKSKWKVGDILWVREPAKVICNYLENGIYQTIDFTYLSDGKIETVYVPRQYKNRKWVQNHQGVPNGCIKEMARTFLRVTNVRVERLQDISDNDVISEGINTEADVDWIRRDYFKILWNKTAPKGYRWEDNPYVFVYEFKKVE